MRKNFIKIAIIILFCLIVWGVIELKLYRLANIHYWMAIHSQLMGWVEKHYFEAILGYVVIFAILLGFYMPFFDFSIILSGFLFGWDGIIYSSLIVVLSSLILYLIGNTLFKSFVQRWVEKSEKMSNMIEQVRRQENFSVFILRFLPLFPFQIITILCSVLGIKKRNFLFFSWLGYLPRMAIYVYIGIKLEQFFELGNSDVSIWQAIPIKSILIILLVLGLFMIAGYWYIQKNNKKVG